MDDDGGEFEEHEENQAMKYCTTALLENPSVSWERISSSRLTISVWKDTEVYQQCYAAIEYVVYF